MTTERNRVVCDAKALLPRCKWAMGRSMNILQNEAESNNEVLRDAWKVLRRNAERNVVDAGFFERL